VTVTLYAATTNPGKLRDFSVAAGEAGCSVEPLPDLGISPPAENEPTFAGNARVKAQYYSRFVQGLVLADDSGLEVDALGGEPGVRSARYAADAGYEPRDADPGISVDVRNNLYLLSRLRGISVRSARYRCALAVARDGTVLCAAEGLVSGEILDTPRGVGGFGYDPLFLIPQLRLTMAEISLDQKHAISHRGQAFRALLPQLRGLRIK
jgi:XTP/dITP diphosphohydrolase